MKRKSWIIIFAVIIAAMLFPIMWQIRICKDYKYEYTWRKEGYEQEVADGIVQDDEKIQAWLNEYKAKWVAQVVVLSLMIVGEVALLFAEVITIFPKILAPKTMTIILLCIIAVSISGMAINSGRIKDTQTELSFWTAVNIPESVKTPYLAQSLDYEIKTWSGILTGDIIHEISYAIITILCVSGICVAYSERLLFYKNAIAGKAVARTEEKPIHYEELPDFDDVYNEILRKNEKND
jgi:hypothetical protein